MIYFFCFFALLLILLSARSLLGGFRYLAFFKRTLVVEGTGNVPFVTIVSPCRGNEPGLKRNLECLFRLDSQAYEIIFVVDSASDTAVPVIDELIRASDRAAKLVIAPKTVRSSQKVENLREAVLHADPRSQAFVFIDSDARPQPGWLTALVSPLSDENVGAATGYRWFISQPATLAGELLAVWNASIASFLGEDTSSNFCWGGSMAIRRDTFERLDIRGYWDGTASDDLALTRALKAQGLPIIFVPTALTASIGKFTFRDMLEFTTRQMKVTRVYSERLWLMTLAGSALFCGVMAAAALIMIVSPVGEFAFNAAGLTLTAVSTLSIGKAWLRMRSVRLILRQYENELKRQMLGQLTLWLVAPAIFLFNCISSALSRRITWRGTTYELKSPTETVIIAD